MISAAGIGGGSGFAFMSIKTVGGAFTGGGIGPGLT
jgi:hypothetical protein